MPAKEGAGKGGCLAGAAEGGESGRWKRRRGARQATRGAGCPSRPGRKGERRVQPGPEGTGRLAGRGQGGVGGRRGTHSKDSGGGEDEQQRECEDAAVAGQHEAAAASRSGCGPGTPPTCAAGGGQGSRCRCRCCSSAARRQAAGARGPGRGARRGRGSTRPGEQAAGRPGADLLVLAVPSCGRPRTSAPRPANRPGRSGTRAERRRVVALAAAAAAAARAALARGATRPARPAPPRATLRPQRPLRPGPGMALRPRGGPV